MFAALAATPVTQVSMQKPLASGPDSKAAQKPPYGAQAVAGAFVHSTVQIPWAAPAPVARSSVGVMQIRPVRQAAVVLHAEPSEPTPEPAPPAPPVPVAPADPPEPPAAVVGPVVLLPALPPAPAVVVAPSPPSGGLTQSLERQVRPVSQPPPAVHAQDSAPTAQLSPVEEDEHPLTQKNPMARAAVVTATKCLAFMTTAAP